MNLNVRKGDNVKVLAGKDKGKTGKVLATDPKSGRVLVEGVNIATHHVKARSASEQSGKKKIEAPLDVSNVQIICPSCGKNVRVRHEKIDGKNARICAKCGASLDASLKADKAKKKADKKAAPKKKADKEAPAEETAAAEATTEVKPEKKAPAKKATAKKPAEAEAATEEKAPAKKPAAKKTTTAKKPAEKPAESEKE
ncbi:MAG: 50S ribosomal protein L24 [Clostridiales bacterium]|nr:50S ribosomal protein L24 [Clostridiales bacterium]